MKALLNKLLVAEPNKDLGLLAFRILAALALMKAHGLPKLLSIQEAITHIPDPLGLGGTFSTYYAIFADVVCALLVAFGFLTRFAALVIISITLTGLIFIHLSDPANVQDTPIIYSVVFGFIAYMGAGKYALDNKFFK